MIELSRKDLSVLGKFVSERELVRIICHILNKEYTDVFFSNHLVFTKEQYQKFIEFIYRRYNDEPLAKIIGSKEFYGLTYETSKDTLDPRPETELIIDLFQKYFPEKTQNINILDLGCGTGCISLTLLNIYENSSATLVDISHDALDVASKNATNLGVSGKCKFVVSDWFENIDDNQKYDVIVTNPPYISSDYKLDRSTLYDPHISLFSGNDGMDSYKVIIPSAHKFLQQGGLLFVEIGFDQKSAVINLAKNLTVIEVGVDISDIDRTIVFKYLDC